MARFFEGDDVVLQLLRDPNSPIKAGIVESILESVMGQLQSHEAAYRSLWPEDDFQATPEALASLAWTNWPLFTVGLVQRGYSDEDVRKIIGGNVLRVARDALESIPLQTDSPD